MNSNSHSRSFKTEEMVFGLLFAAISLLLLVPLLFWKSVEKEPEIYQKIGLKTRLKIILIGILFSLGMGFLLFGMKPELFPKALLGFRSYVFHHEFQGMDFTLFSIGNLPIKASLFLEWVLLNTVLFTLLFFTLPLWNRKISQKKSGSQTVRENVY